MNRKTTFHINYQISKNKKLKLNKNKTSKQTISEPVVSPKSWKEELQYTITKK